MKAAFIYNFAKFVAWPEQMFKTSTDPIVICVLGQNPFGTALADVVSGKSVEGRAFVVRQLSGGQSPTGCQILFVSLSEQKRLRVLLEEIKTAAVLTVGETATFASEGGMINFVIEGGKCVFR